MLILIQTVLREYIFKNLANFNKGESSEIPTVLITGFGPFRNHTVNSSWITVQELLKLNVQDFHIVAKEVSVEYESVSEIVPALWKKYNPKLVVHCGMSNPTRCLTLEQIANNKCYILPDIKGKLPLNNEFCCDGPDTLCTALDIDDVLKDVRSAGVCVRAESSKDAGKYLCEFIYYTSLKISKNTAFIHIPPIDEPYSAKEMAETLLLIVRSMLKQVQSKS